MFDEKEYKAVFSKVTASGETHRRILNMANEKKKNRTFGYASRGLAAAVMASLLAVTAAASGFTWFVDYFEAESEEPLTAEQIDFIEENVQDIHQQQASSGYTLELDSAITDGNTAYVIIDVTAPEGVDLTTEPVADAYERYELRNEDSELITWPENVQISSMTSGWKEDGDGLDNTMIYMIQLSPDWDHSTGEPFGSGATWEIHIKNINREYENVEYKQELLNSKYKGQTDIMFTPEESERLYVKETVAKGTWDFSFEFEDANNEEVELIREPVAASACIAWRMDDTEVYEKVSITSFKLRPLSATIICNYDAGAPDFTNSTDKSIYVVMKDGSNIKLSSDIGFTGEQQLMASTPIILENVDYVLMADGTMISMPE